MNNDSLQSFFRKYRDRYQKQLDSNTLDPESFSDMYSPLHGASEKAKAVHDLPRVHALFRQMTRRPDALFLHLDLDHVNARFTRPDYAIAQVTWILSGVTEGVGEELQQEVSEFFAMGLEDERVVILNWVLDKEEEKVLMGGREGRKGSS